MYPEYMILIFIFLIALKFICAICSYHNFLLYLWILWCSTELDLCLLIFIDNVIAPKVMTINVQIFTGTQHIIVGLIWTFFFWFWRNIFVIMVRNSRSQLIYYWRMSSFRQIPVFVTPFAFPGSLFLFVPPFSIGEILTRHFSHYLKAGGF